VVGQLPLIDVQGCWVTPILIPGAQGPEEGFADRVEPNNFHGSLAVYYE
jgi:hypothetical protein